MEVGQIVFKRAALESGNRGETYDHMHDMQQRICRYFHRNKSTLGHRNPQGISHKLWCRAAAALQSIMKFTAYFFFVCVLWIYVSRGVIACLQLIAPRRGLHSWLIWPWDAGVTQLHFNLCVITCISNCVWLLVFHSDCLGKWPTLQHWNPVPYTQKTHMFNSLFSFSYITDLDMNFFRIA